MVTVAEVNEAFANKGMDIKLPLEESWLVKKVDILEKHNYPGGVRVLLNVRFVDDRGQEVSDLFFCDGSVKRERKAITKPPPEPLKSTMLPVRDQMTFVDEVQALAYLREAFSHLLEDKGYHRGDKAGADIHFEKEGQGFFANLAVRCDDSGLKRAEELIELRRSLGSSYDYGLVVLAFQESLGIPLRDQERWVSRHHDRLALHRIGVFAVDNQDPNKLYAFTTYPRARELQRYFMITTPQWSLVRDRYVETRKSKQ